MKIYTVDEAFEVLKQYKITSNKESIRRWLRNGTITGIAPKSRKKGWKIPEQDLLAFIESRIPGKLPYNTTTIALDEHAAREKMWWEVVRKNIFESFIEVKRRQLRDCIEHKGYSREFETYVWQEIQKNKRGYQTPRIPYLLDAFLFDSNRILMDQNFEDIAEKIIFALIEYLRKKRVKN